jgi:hypothetical protein
MGLLNFHFPGAMVEAESSSNYSSVNSKPSRTAGWTLNRELELDLILT